MMPLFHFFILGVCVAGFSTAVIAQNAAPPSGKKEHKEEPIAVIAINDKIRIPLYDPAKAINPKKNLDELIGQIIESNKVSASPDALEKLKTYYKNKLIFNLVSGYLQEHYISQHYSQLMQGPLVEQELAQKRNSMAVSFFEKHWQKELQEEFANKKDKSQLHQRAQAIATKKGLVYDLVVLIVKGKDAARSVIAGLSAVKKEEDFEMIYSKYDQRALMQNTPASNGVAKSRFQPSDYMLYKKTIDSLPPLFQGPVSQKVKSMPQGQFQGAKYALETPLFLKEVKEDDNQLCLVVIPIQCQKAAPMDYIQQAESELIKEKLDLILQDSKASVILSGEKPEKTLSIQEFKNQSEASPLEIVGLNPTESKKTPV